MTPTRPRVAIFGTSYVDSAMKSFTYRLWAHVLKVRNPGMDIWAIDTAGSRPPEVPGVEVVCIPDNVGHLSRGGGDGWGRAWSRGVELLAGRYDWLVHIEADLLCAVPVEDLVRRVARVGVRIAMPVAFPYNFPETALMVMNAAWVRETRLVERYEWASSPVQPPPEKRLEALAGEDLFLLPMQGARIDMPMSVSELRGAFPDGMDWITHAPPALLREFLVMNAMEEP
jgi:hypothetical protein